MSETVEALPAAKPEAAGQNHRNREEGSRELFAPRPAAGDQS
ncbi:hypothetical protein [Amycolatopsis saalfeldensis]|uniref:Uncharacterized protein n=1 Tax=Amycolatopsis saalfeldensis TaxID=394193 RepID=A0A1H8YMA5_9PSEU|nr:hypothetical protein [Amycolatopsis saalfeldensis]SEP52528.1 hypothetical protein SAMN04489732_120195 [Amycolatopsis saalfeldensis]